MLASLHIIFVQGMFIGSAEKQLLYSYYYATIRAVEMVQIVAKINFSGFSSCSTKPERDYFLNTEFS